MRVTSPASSSRGAVDRKSTRLNSSHANISYAVFCSILRPPCSTLFPYTTLFRSERAVDRHPALLHRVFRGGVVPQLCAGGSVEALVVPAHQSLEEGVFPREDARDQPCVILSWCGRSEEHTSELQSRQYLVCRLLLDSPTTLFYTLSLHDALPI